MSVVRFFCTLTGRFFDKEGNLKLEILPIISALNAFRKYAIESNIEVWKEDDCYVEALPIYTDCTRDPTKLEEIKVPFRIENIYQKADTSFLTEVLQKIKQKDEILSIDLLMDWSVEPKEAKDFVDALSVIMHNKDFRVDGYITPYGQFPKCFWWESKMQDTDNLEVLLELCFDGHLAIHFDNLFESQEYKGEL